MRSARISLPILSSLSGLASCGATTKPPKFAPSPSPVAAPSMRTNSSMGTLATRSSTNQLRR